MRRALPFMALLAGLVPGTAGRSGGAYGQPTEAPGPPMPVLSDTAAYCAQLERRIVAQPARSAEVGRLVSKGHLLCDHGQARRGVLFMRRALIMQRAERGPP